jgi:two-component system NtrC family sensor kinase
LQPKPTRLMDHREFPVLYVDDEPDNLRIFELSFRRQFKIHTATTPSEGLRILHENPIAVVLSDYRMPEMNGVEFLTKVREIDEKCIRILVTAYGDVQILGEAINDGRIYRYLAKPWEPEDMSLTISRAIETYAIDRERMALLNELMLLNRLSHSLHRELDLDRLLALVLDTAHRQLGFDGVAIALLDRGNEQLTWAGLTPDDEVAERIREITLSRNSCRSFFEKLREGQIQSLKVEDLPDLEAPLRSWVSEVSADELLIIPLVGENDIIGLLAVDQRSGSKRFGADDRTLLDGLATQVVIAIENARLVEALRSTREQVKRADRLGTLGTLAAGLAHEINNPLVSIHTFLSLAPSKREEADSKFWVEYHGLAAAELERIRGLVATMSRLASGGRGELQPELVDLALVAREVATLLQREAQDDGITLRVEVQEDALPVFAVRDHLHQVVLNLVCNALHATSAGGEVSIEIGADRDHPRDVVCLAVVDTGVGIPESDVDQIFDPFFTTKEPDEGTGLGLMITHQIVADHGGAIEVRSEPGQGTLIRIKLPVKGVTTS